MVAERHCLQPLRVFIPDTPNPPIVCDCVLCIIYWKRSRDVRARAPRTRRDNACVGTLLYGREI